MITIPSFFSFRSATIYVMSLIAVSLLILTPTAFAKNFEVVSDSIDVHIQDLGDVIYLERMEISFQGAFDGYDRLINTDDRAISHVSVTDDNGNPIPHALIARGDDSIVHVDHRFADEVASLQIRFALDGAVNFFAAGDRIQLPLYTDQHPYPVSNLSVDVHFPEGKILHDGIVQHSILSSSVDVESSVSQSVVRYRAESLRPFESFSITASWPQGVITPRFRDSVQAKYLYWVFAFVMPALYLLFLFWALLRHRTLVDHMNLAVPMQASPPNDTPAAISLAVYSEKFQPSFVVSTILELAHLGYIRIHAKYEKGVFDDDFVYLFEQIHVNYHSLSIYQKLVMELLFAKGRILRFADFNHLTDELTHLFSALVNQSFLEDGYFDRQPRRLHTFFVVYCAVVSLIMLFIAFAIPLTYIRDIVLTEGVLLFILGVIVSHFIPARTAKGVALYNYIRGMRDYFSSDRALSSDITHFSEMLPYADTFSVRDEWIQSFSEGRHFPPAWYRGDTETFSSMLDELEDLF